MLDLEDKPANMVPLFETILDYIPAPEGDPEADTQVLISTIDYNEYVGRIGIGKVDNGTIRTNQDAVVVNHHDPDRLMKVRISRLYEFDGLNRVEVKEASVGSIVAISGIADLSIGDTICSPENPQAIPFQKISEPTIAMQFKVNDSPFAGQEGKYVTSRHIRDRLFRELNTDVSLRVEETEDMDTFKVSGRGELHLSVLIENMRREGYEFAVSKAEVLYHKDEKGRLLEPMETAYIDVPDEFTGVVIEKLGQRKGELRSMGPIGSSYTRMEFSIPSRGLIGYRGDFLTDTKGNGIMNTAFDGYAPYKGDIQYRKQGSLIAFETGESVTYGPLQRPGEGRPLHRPRREGLRRHGHRRERQDGRHRGECLPHEAPDQHPLLQRGRGAAPDAAAGPEPGAGAGLHRHRRAAGGHPQIPAHPQEDPGSQAAQEKQLQQIATAHNRRKSHGKYIFLPF